ncbi:MAG TPA: tetratricopeptide repeat protein [Terriglobia bacterium]|nr:tetratricopeptide repeat protein [Terriglobia bacterium]
MRVTFFVLVFVLAAALPRLCPAAQKDFDEIARDADAARTADRMQDAIHLYRQGVGLRPSWQDGWWWLGSLYYEQDRFPEAQAALARFVAMAPKPGPAYAFLGLSEYETHDYALALEHFRKWALEGSPGTNELIDVASFHWALLLTREGRFLQALFLLTAKAHRRGGSAALTDAMGLASLRMAYLPEDYPPQWREMVWLAGKATFYASLNPQQFDRAQDYEDKLLLHYDQAPNVHYFRGTQFAFQRKPAAAKEEYRQELRIFPQHAPAMMELARFALQEGQLDEAVSLARRAADLEPKNPVAHHVLGQALLAAGRVPESAGELETASQLAPDSASIRFHLATVYRKLGRTQDAEHEMAVFVALKDKEKAGILLPPEELEKLVDEQPGRAK